VRLSYEISADDRQLRRVLRGVEQEARASSRRIGREQNAVMVGPGRREAVASRRYEESQNRAIARNREQLDKQRSRAVLAHIKAEEQARMRADRNAAKAAELLDKQRSRGLYQQLRQAERAQSRAQSLRERTAQGIGRGAATSVARGIGTVARIGGTALALAGGFSAAGALEDQISIRRAASQLAISGGAPGEKEKLAKEAQGVRGFTGAETLGAMQGFVEKTGDLGAARALIQDIGKLSLATSADFGEMGSAAGQAFNVIRDTIKDPKEQIRAVNDVMRTLAAQGNLGAVEIKDMATELAGLGAATRKFEGGPVELLKTVGAMAQASVARGGAASAPEATTAVTRFAQDIVQNQKGFAARGVNVFSDKSHTKLRGPEDIMLDIIEKTGGDLTKINELFGVYAERAVGGFSPLFIEAERKKKGSGRQAVKDEYAKFKDAGLTDTQITERAATRLEDPDLQIKEATKAFNAAVGTELIPVVTRLLPKFTEAIPAIANMTTSVAKVAEYLLQNPFKGIGLVIAASVAKDVAAAGLGSLFQRLLSGAVGGGGVSGVGGAGAAATGAGGLAAGLAGVAAIAGAGAAVDQSQDLAKASGGWGGLWAGIKEVYGGRKSFFGGVDDYMNKQARDKWAKDNTDWAGRPTAGPGSVGADGKPNAQQADLPPALAAALAAQGEAMKAAAGELRAAAQSIGKSGPPEASRVAPINSPSRG